MELNLSDEFPGATGWGTMGSVSKAPNRWVCNICPSRERLIVWSGKEIIARQCLRCFFAGKAPDQQLSLLQL